MPAVGRLWPSGHDDYGDDDDDDGGDGDDDYEDCFMIYSILGALTNDDDGDDDHDNFEDCLIIYTDSENKTGLVGRTASFNLMMVMVIMMIMMIMMTAMIMMVHLKI